MSDEPITEPRGQNRFLGSLRDALAAAGKEDQRSDDRRRKAESGARGGARVDAASASVPAAIVVAPPAQVKAPPPLPQSEPAPVAADPTPAPADPLATQRLSAAEAAQHARGDGKKAAAKDEPTTRIVRPSLKAAAASGDAPRTQLVRGRAKVARADFHQDPVVGWLVIVGGPGLGAYRPVFEGNNTVGRAGSQRIAIDFGDDAISSEEQAYIRYDSVDRSFLFVPNLAKTNVVQVNSQKPTGAVALSAMDVITMGRTQLVFVPFCGSEFDWSELSNLKE